MQTERSGAEEHVRGFLHILTRRSENRLLSAPDANLIVDLNQFGDGLDTHEVRHTWHHEVAGSLERACRSDQELREMYVRAAREPRIS